MNTNFSTKETGSDASEEEEKTEDKANNNAENDAGSSVRPGITDNKKRNKRNLKKKSDSGTSENDAGKLDNANETNEYEQDSSDEEVCSLLAR